MIYKIEVFVEVGLKVDPGKAALANLVDDTLQDALPEIYLIRDVVVDEA